MGDRSVHGKQSFYSLAQLKESNAWLRTLQKSAYQLRLSEKILLSSMDKADLFAIQSFFVSLPHVKYTNSIEKMVLTIEGLEDIENSMSQMIDGFVHTRTRINQLQKERDRKALNEAKVMIDSLHQLAEEDRARRNEAFSLCKSAREDFQKEMNARVDNFNIFTEQSVALVQNLEQALKPLEKHRLQFGDPDRLDTEMQIIWDSSEKFIASLEEWNETQAWNELLNLITAFDEKNLHYSYLLSLYFKKFPEREEPTSETLIAEEEGSCQDENPIQLALQNVIIAVEEESILAPSEIVETNPSEVDNKEVETYEMTSLSFTPPEEQTLVVDPPLFISDSPLHVFPLSTEEPSFLTQRHWTNLEVPVEPSSSKNILRESTTINKKASDNCLMYLLQKFHEFLTRIFHFLSCSMIPIVAYHPRSAVQLEASR